MINGDLLNRSVFDSAISNTPRIDDCCKPFGLLSNYDECLPSLCMSVELHNFTSLTVSFSGLSLDSFFLSPPSCLLRTGQRL